MCGRKKVISKDQTSISISTDESGNLQFKLLLFFCKRCLNFEDENLILEKKR